METLETLRRDRGHGIFLRGPKCKCVAPPSALTQCRHSRPRRRGHHKCQEGCYHHGCDPMRHGKPPYGHERAPRSCGRWAAHVLWLHAKSVARGSACVGGVSSRRTLGEGRLRAARGRALPPLLPIAPCLPALSAALVEDSHESIQRGGRLFAPPWDPPR